MGLEDSLVCKALATHTGRMSSNPPNPGKAEVEAENLIKREPVSDKMEGKDT